MGPYKNRKNGIQDPNVTIARTYKNQKTSTRDPAKTGQPRPRTLVGPYKELKTMITEPKWDPAKTEKPECVVNVEYDWTLTHGICSCRLLYREVVDVLSNYKKSYY